LENNWSLFEKKIQSLWGYGNRKLFQLPQGLGQPKVVSIAIGFRATKSHNLQLPIIVFQVGQCHFDLA
jgi:hypothetical protein